MTTDTMQLTMPLRPQRPPTDNERVLELLQSRYPRWVERPYRTYTCLWHSRVADLRRQGYLIECRRVAVPGERKPDWQYRLCSLLRGEELAQGERE